MLVIELAEVLFVVLGELVVFDVEICEDGVLVIFYCCG